jgi:hypothetical protein
MMISHTQTGNGVHIILSVPEGRGLALLLATGHAASDLREEMLRKLGALLEDDEERYVEIARLQDARLPERLPGWELVVKEALADDRIRKQATELVTKLTRQLGHLIDQRRPVATAAQLSAMKER